MDTNGRSLIVGKHDATSDVVLIELKEYWKLRDHRRGVYWREDRFPEPCGHSGHQPSPKHIPWRAL